MGSGSDIRAGRAFVELGIDKTALSKGLKTIGTEVQAIGAGMTHLGVKAMALGAAITAPMLAAAHTWAASGFELQRMSRQTGVAVETLSALKFAAEESGVAAESVATAFARMSKTVFAAASGSSEANLALARLGLSVADLMRLSPEEKFDRIGQKIAAIGDPTQQTAVAMQVFGRSAAELLPLFNSGAGGLAKFREEAENLGLVKSTASVAAAAELHRVWLRLEGTVRLLSGAIGQALAPLLTRQAQAMMLATRQAVAWLNAHRPLVVQAFQLGTALFFAGATLLVLGKAMSIAGGAVLGLRFALSVLGIAGYAVTVPLGLLRMGFSGITGVVGFAGRAIGLLRLDLLGSAAAATVSKSAMLGLSIGGTAARTSLGALSLVSRGAGLALGGAMKGAAAGVKLLPGLFSLVGSAATGGMKLAVLGVQALHRANVLLVGTVKAAWSAIQLMGGLGAVLERGLGMGMAAVRAGLMAIPGILSAAYSLAAAAVSAVWTAVPVVISAVWMAGAAAVSLAWSALMAIPGLLSAAYTFAAGIVTTVWSAIPVVLAAAWGVVLAIPGAMTALFALAAANLPLIMTVAMVGGIAILAGMLVKRIVGVFYDAGKKAGGALVDAAVDGAGRAKDAIGSIGDNLVTAKEKALAVGAGLKSGFSGAMNWTSGAIASLGEKLSAAGQLAVDGFKEVGPKIASSFSDLWKGIVKDAKGSFSVIADALKGGDMQGAMKVLVALLKLEWERFRLFLEESWAALSDWWGKNSGGMMAPIYDLIKKVQDLLAEIGGLIQKAKQYGREAEETWAAIHGSEAVEKVLNRRQKSERRQATSDFLDSAAKKPLMEQLAELREAQSIDQAMVAHGSDQSVEDLTAIGARIQVLQKYQQEAERGGGMTPEKLAAAQAHLDQDEGRQAAAAPAPVDAKGKPVHDFSAAQARIDAREKELAEARKEVAAANAKRDKDAKAADKKKKKGDGKKPPKDFSMILGGNKIQGGFNAAAVGMMGGNATERIVRELRTLNHHAATWDKQIVKTLKEELQVR